jgi:hypothetical protein
MDRLLAERNAAARLRAVPLSSELLTPLLNIGGTVVNSMAAITKTTNSSMSENPDCLMELIPVNNVFIFTFATFNTI